MIISRTPYRISFFGGGTDYPVWYEEHGASVLSSTINHYCYLQCRLLPPFFQHKHRVAWSRVEEIKQTSDIQHPSVRAIIESLGIQHGLEISHQGDLPARSGLGSSSAFTVGLLNALYGLQGMISSKKELACEAIHVERDILKENVGVQDQIETAFGGLNLITVKPDGTFDVIPQLLSPERLRELQQHLLLFFTGVSRTASDIAGEKIKSIPKKFNELHEMQKMVSSASALLAGQGDLNDFGKLLHESWKLKRQISKGISPGFIDDIYETAVKAGATGGKLLGAGGGGFMLFFVQPEYREAVCKALEQLLLVPVEFESGGSQIIFYDRPNYSHMASDRRNYLHLQDSKTSFLNQHKTPSQRPTRIQPAAAHAEYV